MREILSSCFSIESSEIGSEMMVFFMHKFPDEPKLRKEWLETAYNLRENLQNISVSARSTLSMAARRKVSPFIVLWIYNLRG